MQDYRHQHLSKLLTGIIPILVFCAEPLCLRAEQPPRPLIALYTNTQQPIPADAEIAMRKELDWITDPIGMRFDWRIYAAAGRYSAVARLAVIQFKGKCDTEDLTIFHQFPWKLGWTHTVDGHIIPYVDVFCDAIRAFIAPSLQLTPPAQRDAVFGRALGRVVAHELYHVFAETRKHGSSGLAGAHCTPEDLVAEEIHFGSEELRRLRTVLAQTRLLAESPNPASEGERVFAANGCVGCHGLRGEGTSKAPELTATRIPNDASSLRMRLANTASRMHKLSQKLDLSWSRIKADELETLVRFLKTATGDAVTFQASPNVKTGSTTKR